jgi:small subunit ribosomal protein S3
MGQKVHPKIFRIGITRSWDGIWFAKKKDYKNLLEEDVMMREYLGKKLKSALVDSIIIERSRQEVRLIIHSAKPGIVIGRGGSGIEDLTKDIKRKFFRGRRVKLSISVKEVQKPALSANVIGQQIAADIEKRMPFRRVMKMARDRSIKEGAQGVKITVAGRLNGADIARSETVSQGKIPLHNLRSDIDYASIMARTIYGVIGVKVWVNRGEVFDKK